MQYWMTDASGYPTGTNSDFDADTPNDPAFPAGDKVVPFATEPWIDFIKPKADAGRTTFVEDEVAGTVLQLSKDRAIIAAYDKYDVKWCLIHGSILTSMEHKAKIEEANTVQATGAKPDSVRTANDDTPYLDEELAQRITEGEGSLTLADVAAEVVAAEFTDVTDTAKLGMFRKKAIRAINAATDKAGLDTALTQMDTDLATI